MSFWNETDKVTFAESQTLFKTVLKIHLYISQTYSIYSCDSITCEVLFPANHFSFVCVCVFNILLSVGPFESGALDSLL